MLPTVDKFCYLEALELSTCARSTIVLAIGCLLSLAVLLAHSIQLGLEVIDFFLYTMAVKRGGDPDA